MVTDADLIATSRARRTIRDTPAVARDLRRQADLTLAEVGEALGVSHVAVLRWETGERVPRGDLARRYLELLREAVAG